jgi:hypothetical protein
VQVADGIGVQAATVPVDRPADGARMGREVEPAHVDQRARDAKLGPDVVPAERGVCPRGGRDLVETAQPCRGEPQTGADEQLPAVHVGIDA